MEQARGSCKRQRNEGDERGTSKKLRETRNVSPLLNAALDRMDEIHTRYNKGTESEDMRKDARLADLEFLIRRVDWNILATKFKVAELEKALGIEKSPPQ